MSLTMDLSNRLAAMNIDEATRADLRELRPLVVEHIDAAIAAAYTQILQFPEVKRVGNHWMRPSARSGSIGWKTSLLAPSPKLSSIILSP